MTTKARPGGPPALVVSSKLPRFQELYTLRVALRCAARDSGRRAAAGLECERHLPSATKLRGQQRLVPSHHCRPTGGGGGGEGVSLTKSVGEYFHEVRWFRTGVHALLACAAVVP